MSESTGPFDLVQVGEYQQATNTLFGRPARELLAVPRVPTRDWCIEAREWNGLVTRLAASRFLGARQEIRTQKRFRHPWHTSLTWDTETARWAIEVGPGLVNGHAAEVKVPTREAPPATLNRLREKAAPRASATTLVPARLTERPKVRIAPTLWRIAGVEGGYKGPPLPEFFTKTLGIVQGGEESVLREQGIGFVDHGTAEERSRRVLVRVCYLVLSMARVRTEASADKEGNLVLAYTGGTGAEPPTLTLAKEEPATESGREEWGNLSSLSALMTAEPGRDQIVIAALWLVSPEGLPPGPKTVPDGTWTPYVQQRCFWNLCYALSRPVADFVPTKLSLPSPLFGGDIIKGLLDQQNSLDAALSAQISRGIVRGKFYGC